MNKLVNVYSYNGRSFIKMAMISTAKFNSFIEDENNIVGSKLFKGYKAVYIQGTMYFFKKVAKDNLEAEEEWEE